METGARKVGQVMSIKRRDDYLQVLQYWNEEGPVARLISKADGSILWANTEFQRLIGYSYSELVDSSFSWIKLTPNAEDLKHDQEMLQSILNGDRNSYSITKMYRPSGKVDIRVRIHVHRWPLVGSVEFFLVTVIPLINGQLLAYEQSISIVERLAERMEKLEASMGDHVEGIIQYIKESTPDNTEEEILFYFRPLVRLCVRKPRVAFSLFLVMFLVMAGVPLIDIVSKVLNLPDLRQVQSATKESGNGGGE